MLDRNARARLIFRAEAYERRTKTAAPRPKGAGEVNRPGFAGGSTS
jgi:hypothetical protein